MTRLIATSLVALGLAAGPALAATPMSHGAGHQAAAAGTAQQPPAGMNCAGEPVVWVNTKTHVFHRPGSRYYGKTKAGKFVCQHAATQEGDHAAKGEK